jgi:hypothetical protein
MRKEFRTIKAGDQGFRVTWDMVALHMLEKAGNASTLDIIHAGIIAAAANDGRSERLTVLQLGVLFDSKKQQEEALAAVVEVAKANGQMLSGEEAGKAPSEAVNPPASLDVTNAQPSTLELTSSSSGG